MHTIISLITDYGYPAMLFVVFVENMGIPFPTEPAYIVGQALITQGKSDFFAVLLVLTAGHLAGAILSYAAGRRIGKRIKDRGELSAIQHKLAHWYDRYGPATVFATRLIGYVRPWSSYAAGIAEIDWMPFLLYTLLGTVLFNAVTLAITGQIVYLWQHYRLLRLIINLSFLVGLGFVAWHLAREKRNKRRR